MRNTRTPQKPAWYRAYALREIQERGGREGEEEISYMTHHLDFILCLDITLTSHPPASDRQETSQCPPTITLSGKRPILPLTA